MWGRACGHHAPCEHLDDGNPNAGPTGTKLQDSATLSSTGTLEGTGSITFKLYAPGDTHCTTPIHTETVTGISSDGPFSTTTGYVAKSLGRYNWTASFSGDGNNSPASTACGAGPAMQGRSPPPPRRYMTAVRTA